MCAGMITSCNQRPSFRDLLSNCRKCKIYLLRGQLCLHTDHQIYGGSCIEPTMYAQVVCMRSALQRWPQLSQTHPNSSLARIPLALPPCLAPLHPLGAKNGWRHPYKNEEHRNFRKLQVSFAGKLDLKGFHAAQTWLLVCETDLHYDK